MKMITQELVSELIDKAIKAIDKWNDLGGGYGFLPNTVSWCDGIEVYMECG